MIRATFTKRILNFNSPGGTSRGILYNKRSWFLQLFDDHCPDVNGTGEISIIPNLSIENDLIIEDVLADLCANTAKYQTNWAELLRPYPAIKFGFETALIDLQNGGKNVLFPSDFTQGKQGIVINGLIWMGNKEEMLKRIKEKLDSGFSCLKLKVGAINFDDEIELLRNIRKHFSPNELELRVDANGAFSYESALAKLNRLAEFTIHSIEQPIKQGQWEAMSNLCKNTPIPIALDEELIGINKETEQLKMLKLIQPQYVIFKPSLIGGLHVTKKWSELANTLKIGWWVTSALEANIGLNAIAQWTYKNGSDMPQGLGTGTVFSNNIASPLTIKGEKIWYDTGKQWDSINE